MMIIYNNNNNNSNNNSNNNNNNIYIYTYVVYIIYYRLTTYEYNEDIVRYISSCSPLKLGIVRF